MGGSHAGGSGGPHDVSLLGPIGGHRSTVKTAFKIAEGAATRSERRLCPPPPAPVESSALELLSEYFIVLHSNLTVHCARIPVPSLRRWHT